MNDILYKAIKKSLIEDIKGVYDYFKENTENLEGVIIQFNSSRGIGEYLKDNPKKLTDMIEYLYNNLNFSIRLVITREGDDEFYPLIES